MTRLKVGDTPGTGTGSSQLARRNSLAATRKVPGPASRARTRPLASKTAGTSGATVVV